MSDDLISLRVLSCLGGTRDFYFLQQAANIASIPVPDQPLLRAFTAARKVLATSEVDIALLDANRGPGRPDIVHCICTVRTTTALRYSHRSGRIASQFIQSGRCGTRRRHYQTREHRKGKKL